MKKLNLMFSQIGKYMRIKIIVVSFFGLLAFWACEEANPIRDEGNDVLQAYGQMESDTLYAIADTFFVEGKVNTGSSPKLLLGNNQDFEGRFLVKFSTLPNDTIAIDSLKIIVSAPGSFGDDTNPILGKVYRVTGAWEESVNTDPTWDYLNNIDISPETSASFEFPKLDSTSYTDYEVELPSRLVDIWRDTTAGDQNHGLLFDFDGADHIKEFSSREGFFSSRRPRLVFTYRDEVKDTTLRDTIYATMDASLIDYKGIFDQSKIYVAAGYEANAFFKFNFDSIPANAYMVSVEFRFTEDTLSSLVNSNRTTEIYLRNVTTEFNQLPFYRIDSTFTFNVNHSVVLTESTPHILSLRDSRRAVVSRSFIQDIINQFMIHGSFYLQFVNPGNDISVYAIESSENATGIFRPHIILEYYVQTAPRL